MNIKLSDNEHQEEEKQLELNDEEVKKVEDIEEVSSINNSLIYTM